MLLCGELGSDKYALRGWNSRTQEPMYLSPGVHGRSCELHSVMPSLLLPGAFHIRAQAQQGSVMSRCGRNVLVNIKAHGLGGPLASTLREKPSSYTQQVRSWPRKAGVWWVIAGHLGRAQRETCQALFSPGLKDLPSVFVYTASHKYVDNFVEYGNN